MKKNEKIIHDEDYFPKDILEKWKKKIKNKKSKVGKVVKAK